MCSHRHQIDTTSFFDTKIDAKRYADWKIRPSMAHATMKCLLILLLLATAIVITPAFQSATFRRAALVHKRLPSLQRQSSPTLDNQNRVDALSMTSTSDDDSSPEESSDDDKTSKLVQEYQTASIAYGVTIAVMLLRHGILNVDVLYSATGPFLGASLAYILKGAAENDRLSSDTYKRLSLLSLGYAALGTGIVVTLLVRALFTKNFPSFAYALFGVANGLALIPAFKGFKSGAGKENKDLVKEVWEVTKDSAKGLVSVENASAIVYLVGTWLFGVVKLYKFLEIFYRIKVSGVCVFIYLR